MTKFEIILVISVALVSIVVTFFITRHYSIRRHLYFVLYSVYDIVKLSKLSTDKVKILYKDAPVDSICSIKIFVHNRGNMDITESMVHHPTFIKFREGIEIIDAIQLADGYGNSVGCRVNQASNSIVFDVDYIKRRSRLAFQVLAYSPNGSSISNEDLEFRKGTIENTKVSFSDDDKSLMYKTSHAFINFVRKHPKAIVFAYAVISIGMILIGLFRMLLVFFPGLITFQVFGWSVPETFELGEAISSLFIGVFLLLPTIALNRRANMFALFKPNDEE